MGTKTLGSTANGTSGHFYYDNFSSGEAWKSHSNYHTSTEEMYIDAIYVYARTVSGSATFKHGLYNTSGTLLATATTNHAWNTTLQWTHSEFPAGSYYHVTGSGVNLDGAVVNTTSGGLRADFYNDGGSFDDHTGIGSLPSSFGGANNTWGSLPWYVTYFPKCTVDSISVSGATEGTSITLTGKSYSAGVNSISFNGTAAITWSVVNDTTLTVTVPTGATTGAISVATNAGTGVSATFYVNPTISSTSASSGSPGATVYIYGTGFNSATNVKFYNGVTASYTVNSDTQITTTVPHGATTGVITVYGGDSSATSASFKVITSITSFSPTAGGVGTSVVITGNGFTGATAVKFNGTAASSYTVNSDTQITAVVAAGSTTGYITVTGTGSSNTATSATVFTVASAWTYRTGVWGSAPVEVERSGVETQAEGVFVYRSGAWVSAE